MKLRSVLGVSYLSLMAAAFALQCAGQNRNVATADEAALSNTVISSKVDSQGNPSFLGTSANTTLTISCTATPMISYISGQLQICSTDRTLAVGATPSVTQYIIQKQDTTNATVQAADFVASSATPVYAPVAPTCPTSPQGIALSSTNPAFWFDQSTGLAKLCTSNGGSYSSSASIVLGFVTVDATPKISAVAHNPFRSIPNSIVTGGDLFAKSGRPWIDIGAYLADPTGVASSVAAFTNAVAACPSGGCNIKIPPGNYLIDSVITIPANKAIRLEGSGAGTVLTCSFTGAACFSASGTGGTTSVLTANCAAGALSCTATGHTGWAINNWVQIADTKDSSAGCTESPAVVPSNSCSLELQQIQFIDTSGTNDVIYWKSSLDYSYTTAATATMTVITPVYLVAANFSIDASAFSGSVFRVLYGIGLRMNDIKVTTGGLLNYFLSMQRCKHSIIAENEIGSADGDLQQGTGYGYAINDDEGTAYSSVRGNTIRKMRHGVIDSRWANHDTVIGNTIESTFNSCMDTHGNNVTFVTFSGNVCSGLPINHIDLAAAPTGLVCNAGGTAATATVKSPNTLNFTVGTTTIQVINPSNATFNVAAGTAITAQTSTTFTYTVSCTSNATSGGGVVFASRPLSTGIGVNDSDSHIQIIGNSVSNYGLSGIQVQANSLGNSVDVLVEGNIITTPLFGLSLSTVGAIIVQNMRDVTVSNNKITDIPTNQQGIYILTSDYVTVTGNSLRQTLSGPPGGTLAIYWSDSTNGNLTNNSCIGSMGNDCIRIGSSSSGSTNQLYMAGNGPFVSVGGGDRGLTISTNATNVIRGPSLQTTAPAVTSGFGSSPSVTGTDQSFQVNVGTGGSATTGTITFLASWGKAPRCTVGNETGTLFTKAAPTATTVVLTGISAWAASTLLDVNCQ